MRRNNHNYGKVDASIIGGTIGGTIEGTIEGTVEGTVEETVEETVENNSDRIIELIKEDPYITAKQIQAKIDLSRRGVEYQINNLKERNVIKRIGPNKGGYWKILDK